MRYQQTPRRRRIDGPKGGRNTCILTVLECQYHGQYSGYIYAMSRQPVDTCPQCRSDNDWYYQAATALHREGNANASSEEVLARAEAMAGHSLKRRRHV